MKTTCMLEKGHRPPCRWTCDDKIGITFTNPAPSKGA